MKQKIIILFALLAFSVSSAVAQSGIALKQLQDQSAKRKIYVSAVDKNGNDYIVCSDGRNIGTGYGRGLKAFGVNNDGVWTLKYKGYAGENYYALYKNGKQVKFYCIYMPQGWWDDGKEYLTPSIAMRVKEGKVIVCVVYCNAKDKDRYQMYGEINQKEVFRTGWTSAEYGKKVGVKWTVNDCDEYNGKIYAAGNGMRRYSTGTVSKTQHVRYCGRVWCNGQDAYQLFENQSSNANAITMTTENGKISCHTAGDHRGKVWAWHNTSDFLKTDKEGTITRAAVVSVDNERRDYYVYDGALCDNQLRYIYRFNGHKVVDVVSDGYQIFFLVELPGKMVKVFSYDPRLQKGSRNIVTKEVFHATMEPYANRRLAVY